jgi:hypothetical protein
MLDIHNFGLLRIVFFMVQLDPRFPTKNSGMTGWGFENASLRLLSVNFQQKSRYAHYILGR